MFEDSSKSPGNAGVSIIYVMAALIVTGFIGVSMMKMVSGDRITNALYSSSASARSAAAAGITSAIYRFQDPSDTLIRILQRRIRARQRTDVLSHDWWLRGSSNSYDTLEGMIQYRTKLLAFDTSTFNVTLQSEAIGKGGSRAHSLSIYHLDGLTFNDGGVSGFYPTNALHCGGGMGQINATINIFGGAYVRDSATFNTGAGFSHIYDAPFRTNRNSDGDMFIKGFVFHTPAYFGVPLRFNGNNLRFKKGAAFEEDVTNSGAFHMYVDSGNVYFNGDYSTGYSQRIDMSSNSSGKAFGWKDRTFSIDGVKQEKLASLLLGGYKASLTDSMENLQDSIVIPREEPVDIFCDIDIVRPFAIDATFGWGNLFEGGINAGRLQDIYDSIKSNHSSQMFGDNQDYLVLNIKDVGGSHISSTQQGLFNGKVIFIVEETLKASGKTFYNHSADARTFIYIGNDCDEIGSLDIGTGDFRGYIYVNSQEQTIFKAAGGNLYGGVYVNSGKFEINGAMNAAPINFRYDEDVVKDFAELGLFFDTLGNTTTTTGDSLILEPGFDAVDMKFVGQAM